MITIEIVRFCSVECKMQMSGEESVYWMVDGYEWAQENSQEPPIPEQIEWLGSLIEPYKNASGFRHVPVYVSGNEKLYHALIPEAINSLCQALENYTLEPDEWFREYENIHPFVDGNGRTGAILFNWISGTLDNPKWPPNFWHDPRRKPGYGC